MTSLHPTRQAGLERLDEFASSMGRAYTERRNYDFGPDNRSNISMLSPYTRHRLITEQELARTALETHSLMAAEKFIQEVCWRTYWKGWLEHRPSVWSDYTKERDECFAALEANSGLRTAYTDAVDGRTGIDAFDAWVSELVEYGYLHNHARMWFASIWIYTLNLPWSLGADFFLQHLMDADAATNTLSWRWVCGLHTQGKTYQARRSNIEKFTDGRFSPANLATDAPPLDGFENPKPGLVPPASRWPDGPFALLVTDEDLSIDELVPNADHVTGVAGLVLPNLRSPKRAAAAASAFTHGALDDALNRCAEAFGQSPLRLKGEADPINAIIDWAVNAGTRTIVTPNPHIGWTRPVLDEAKATLAIEHDIQLVYVRRDWDEAFWPHAKKGFFKLKKQIPNVLAELGLPV